MIKYNVYFNFIQLLFTYIMLLCYVIMLCEL